LSKTAKTDAAASSQVRLDKWLWAARFFKTRSLAKEAIEGGKVYYNGHRTKPGKTVDQGAVIRIRNGWQEKSVIIEGISDKRRGAPEAQLLYQETPESQQKREDNAWQRKTMQAAQLPPARRPNKKQRREIQRIKHQVGDQLGN
jgi:ribosome-associated heat shock protein Hsp15